MEIRKVFASLTFRYIAKYLLVLTGAVFFLVAAIYLFYSYSYFRDLSASIVDEEETLRLIYRGQGLAGLEQYLGDRREDWYVDQFHYLVRDAGGQKLGGDLPSDTVFREFEDGWIGFELALLEWGREVDAEFLARDVALSDDRCTTFVLDVFNQIHAHIFKGL